MSPATQIFSIVNLSLYLIVTFMGLLWQRREPRNRYYATPVIFWTGHLVVFYVVVLVFADMDATTRALWSASIRTQAAFTTGFILYDLLTGKFTGWFTHWFRNHNGAVG